MLTDRFVLFKRTDVQPRACVNLAAQTTFWGEVEHHSLKGEFGCCVTRERVRMNDGDAAVDIRLPAGVYLTVRKLEITASAPGWVRPGR